MKRVARMLSVLFLLFIVPSAAFGLDAGVKAKVDAKVPTITEWGKDPALVAAVKELAANPSTASQGMTQDVWKGLGMLDPKVREFQTNKVGAFLKSKKEAWVAEAFVSQPDGSKVGLLAKTSSWSHKGKPKHDMPMSGSTWIGEVEMDQSSGRESVQVAVPVLDGATPIGSLVVGIEISKL